MSEPTTHGATYDGVEQRGDAPARPNGRRIVLFGAVTAAVVLLAAAIAWRAHGGGPSTEATAPPDVPHLEGAFIRFSTGFAERAGIRAESVASSALAPTVGVTGTVTFDPEHVAAVGSRIAGRVRRVLKIEGDAVKAGDALAEIESAELGEAQAALSATKAKAEVAAVEERRQRKLADERITAEREAEVAKANAAAARAELHAAEQRVRALGGTGGGEIGVLVLRSPIAGKVVEAKVSRGQSVEPSYTAFRVADLDELWVELAVFERELAAIQEGDEVEIAPQTNASATVRGKVARVGDVIDLDTRSAQVRVEVSNSGHALRPGQSVLARILVHAQPTPSIVVPRAAVTRVDGKPTVFVAHDATSVEPRVVELGGQDAQRVEVVSGLKDGERVIVAGVFALKSEIFR